MQLVEGAAGSKPPWYRVKKLSLVFPPFGGKVLDAFSRLYWPVKSTVKACA